MTINDEEKTIVLTETQFRETSFKAIEKLTDEFKDVPQKALMVLMLGTLIAGKIASGLFDEDAPESEDVEDKLKFGDN